MPHAGGGLRGEQVVVEVSKNLKTAASSQEGEFDTSITTDAPVRASARPSPVRVLTPVLGEADTASWPCSPSLVTSFAPMSPLPPMTTIFIEGSFLSAGGTRPSGRRAKTGQPPRCDRSTETATPQRRQLSGPSS
jgi:hypothetical protein